MVQNKVRLPDRISLRFRKNSGLVSEHFEKWPMRFSDITVFNREKTKLKKKLSCVYDNLGKTKEGTISNDQITKLLLQCKFSYKKIIFNRKCLKPKAICFARSTN